MGGPAAGNLPKAAHSGPGMRVFVASAAGNLPKAAHSGPGMRVFVQASASGSTSSPPIACRWTKTRMPGPMHADFVICVVAGPSLR